jgi:alanine-glyoxylate transaminase/serine-glyoxylate transaminase/serine-pyruvate transaminase
MRAPPETDQLAVPSRILMGPGPSMISPRVRQAMAAPALGYMDPDFLDVLDDIQELLRYTFQTDNEWTLATSGTGTAAMETAIGNLVEPGDTMLVRTNGYWGDRMAQMARRVGGEVAPLDVPATAPVAPGDVEAAFAEHDVDVFAFCHADTTTGIRQPDVPELTGIAREHDAYTIMDCVTSLSGVEVRVDDWGVDAAYGSPQKCLSCTPGVTPLTVNDRAREKILNRETDPVSWYLDLAGVMGYWGEDPSYHHTPPTSSLYGLRESLRMVAAEGLEERWERHREVAGELVGGLERLGLELFPERDHWLPSLNTVRVPDGVDDTAVIEFLLTEYNIEIASGLGDLSGEVWRIGCMGYSARRQNVAALLNAMAEALAAQNYDTDRPRSDTDGQTYGPTGPDT